MVRIVAVKLAASSIVEVSVAMVIASLSFGLALLFFGQLAFGSLYHKPVKAQQLAISLLSQTMAEEAYISQLLEHDQYMVKRTLETYSFSTNVLLVKIEVFGANDKLIAEAKQLVYVENP